MPTQDERQPLLAPGRATPLPRMQLLVLCMMRMTEHQPLPAISYTVIFPFVTQMLAENLPHVPASQLGYYAGIVESVYALVQFTTIFFWGRLSDSIGRKPVLLTGLCGTAISVTAFGLAPSFPAMIVARSIAGLMNGNIAVLKSVMGEITDHTNQARAFSLIPICFALGSIVGSTLGGNLAHPAENLPAWFGGWSVLKRFPFLLPCLLASSLNVTAVLLGWLFLKETLPSKTRREEQRPLLQDQDEDEDHSTHPEPETQTQTEAEVGVEVKPSVRSLMTPAITQVLTTQFFLNLLNASHAALLPLFCYEPVSDGGLGFSPREIGLLMATNGVVTILTQLFFFPRLERRMGGPLQVYKSVTLFMPFVFACLPLAHRLARSHPHSKAWPTAALALGIAMKATSNMSIVCSSLLVNNSAPTRSSLGRLNGVSQMFACLSRFVGPAAATSLFAFSTSKRVLDGQIVWLVICLMSFSTWLLTLRVQAPTHAAWRRTE